MRPHVTCVCVTADRQKMTDRAVASFLAQTYPNKSLLIWDNGKSDYHEPPSERGDGTVVYDHLGYIHSVKGNRGAIGAMRNWANGFACDGAAYGHETDIIAHWDSDDWSHPLRLAWQVQALKSREALDAVGYRSMLFWVRAPLVEGGADGETPALSCDGNRQAWLYSSDKPKYALGTSLMYWRRTWETHPFREDVKFGEDNEWIKPLNLLSDKGFFKDEPAMIAEHHGANLTDHSQVIGNSPNWARVPEWDKSLAERMRL